MTTNRCHNSIEFRNKHQTSRHQINMRNTFDKSTKLTITKVGSSIRSRSSAFFSTDLLRLPPKCATPFEFHTPAEELNENIEASAGNLFDLSRSRQVLTRLPLRFRSLSKIIVAPLSTFSSSVDMMSENVTPGKLHEAY
jgi:hypothetical protein